MFLSDTGIRVRKRSAIHGAGVFTEPAACRTSRRVAAGVGGDD